MFKEFDDEDIDRQLADLEELPSGDLEDLQRSPHLALLTLYAEDSDELADFYEGVFGFERRYQSGNAVELQAGVVTLSICDSSALLEVVGLSSIPPVRDGRSSATFLVEDVDSSYEAAVAMGALGLRPPHDTEWGMRSAWLRDPAGNLLEIGRWQR